MLRKRSRFGVPEIVLDRTSPVPLYRQIRDQMAEAIGRGGIAPGARIPPTRVLARMLGVSRNTVLYAYDTLAGEEWIEGRRGSGVRVAGRGTPLQDAVMVLRKAQYPLRQIFLEDPDGNAIALSTL